jgi:phage tail tape-measure protein
MPVLLFGVVIGAGFFVATFWSLFQALRAKETLRMAHSAAAVLSLFMMAALSTAHPLISAVAGALLVGAGAVAVILERGFARLFPVSQIAVGVAVAVGLPFAA